MNGAFAKTEGGTRAAFGPQEFWPGLERRAVLPNLFACYVQFCCAFQEVMQDYRNEMKEVFAMDKQLAAELEYDMRKYEEQLDRERGQGQSQDATLETEALNTAPTGQVRAATHNQWIYTAAFVCLQCQKLPILP